jgi:anti-sigma B factor antagonist
MTDELRYETESRPGELRVHIFGDLDMTGTLRLEQELERMLEAAPERLVIDLSGAHFIDSTGMNLLISTEHEARMRGIDVEFVPGPPEVMRVFESTGLTDVLPFRASA